MINFPYNPEYIEEIIKYNEHSDRKESISEEEILIQGAHTFHINLFSPFLTPGLLHLSLRKCHITHIPNDLLIHLTQLRTLDLYANAIEKLDFFIPNSVKTIDLSFNCVNEIISKLPDNLDFINLDYNYLKEVPNGFPIAKASLQYNETVFQQKVIEMPIIFNRPVAEINNNSTDVHSTQIQRNTSAILKFILTNKSFIKRFPINKKFIEELRDYRRKTRKWYHIFIDSFMTNLDTYLNHPTTFVYDYIMESECRIRDVIERLWAVAKDSKDTASMIGQLEIEMTEGLGYCFVGKISRIVNVFTPYIVDLFDSELIMEDIPIKQKMSEKISSLLKKYEDKAVIVKEFTEFAKEIKASQEEIDEWLEALKEF